MRNGTLHVLGILACAALGAGTGLAQAGPVGPMTNFTAGTTARASEVNANFSAVKSAVDDNDGRITTNAAGIATNAANITGNAAGIATNAANITDNNAALIAEINALRAQLAASVACPANTPTRFTDNGDGTVCDSQTGLMWEIKTGTAGTLVTCTATDCPDAHDVNNRYTWSTIAANLPTLPTQNQPDGTLYTNFLERLNDLKTANDGTATPCFAGHCDWRLPTIGELRSIVRAPSPFCGANAIFPCIAEGFPGETQAFFYWSSSVHASTPDNAWVVSFVNGDVSVGSRSLDLPARAVRGGR